MGESIVLNPYETYRGAAKSWNNAAERIPGWPSQRLSVPSRQTTFSLPWSAFPATLEADVELRFRRAAGADLSDDHFNRRSVPRRLRPDAGNCGCWRARSSRAGSLPIL